MGSRYSIEFPELPNCLVHLRQMSVLVPHKARDHVDIENNNNNNNNNNNGGRYTISLVFPCMFSLTSNGMLQLLLLSCSKYTSTFASSSVIL